jgi:hypothetical protein
MGGFDGGIWDVGTPPVSESLSLDRRQRNTAVSIAMPIPAKPPTTPPTIAPTGAGAGPVSDEVVVVGLVVVVELELIVAMLLLNGDSEVVLEVVDVDVVVVELDVVSVLLVADGG